jgi:hypothetical protein
VGGRVLDGHHAHMMAQANSTGVEAPPGVLGGGHPATMV